MRTFAEKLIIVLEFLESNRPGFVYELTLSRKKSFEWVATVVGTSKVDKSYPHEFISVQSTNFDELPELIQMKAKELLETQMKSFTAALAKLQSDEKELQAKIEKFQNLKL